MATSNECACCGCEVGEGARVQPCRVNGEKDFFCPRCFIGVRMARDPATFNPSQSCTAKCHSQSCGWTALSFGALPTGGRLRCGHCGQFTAIRIDFSRLVLSKREREYIEELARSSGLEPHRLTGEARSRPRARA